MRDLVQLIDAYRVSGWIDISSALNGSCPASLTAFEDALRLADRVGEHLSGAKIRFELAKWSDDAAVKRAYEGEGREALRLLEDSSTAEVWLGVLVEFLGNEAIWPM